MTVQTSIVYTGAGDSGPFAVPFPYLSKSHIQVRIDDVTVAFTWPTDSSIQLGAPAAAGAVIEIRRVTPRDTRLVDFTDGSVLTEADLDLAILQQLYIAQETAAEAEKTIRTSADGNFDAQSKRIINVAAPTADTDAATKGYADTVSGAASATAAAASASAAAASAAAAAQSAADAQSGGVGVTDGDKGDITVSNSGAAWTLDQVVDPGKVPSGSKTGADSRFVTGTAGSENTAAMWNADGDLVEIAAAAGDSIPFTAPGGSGNLAASVNTLGELRDAVDALTVSTGQTFLSSAQTFSNSSSLVVAHGLGVEPTFVQVIAECVTADGDFSVGDRILLQPNSYIWTATVGFSLEVDATNVTLHIASAIRSINHGGGSNFDVDPTNWRLYVFASTGIAAGGVGGGGGGLANLVEDLSPQLGGDLDTNGRNIIIDGGRGINDELGNEVVRISRDTAAANYLQIVTSNTGGAPKIDAVGDDANIGLQLRTKGTGQVFLNDDRALTTADEGTGNGLDADTVDGLEASAFAAAAHTHTAGDVSGLASVATSGAYSDLTGAPSIPTQASLSVDHLITLSGRAEGADNLGTFTGTTISDNVTIKVALQALETAVESASGGGLLAVVNDTSPQLGGNLELNSNWLIVDNEHGFLDSDGNEILQFTRSVDAVNHLEIRNAITGFSPKIDAVGDDANVNIQYRTKGTGEHRFQGDIVLTGDMTATGTIHVDRAISFEAFGPTDNVAVGDGAAYVTIPSFMAGMDLVAARADVAAAGTTGNTTIQVRNVTQAADMLSGLITIASGATASSSVAIDAANDDVAAGDRLRIDVDSVATTAPQGLTVTLEFSLP